MLQYKKFSTKFDLWFDCLYNLHQLNHIKNCLLSGKSLYIMKCNVKAQQNTSKVCRDWFLNPKFREENKEKRIVINSLLPTLFYTALHDKTLQTRGESQGNHQNMKKESSFHWQQFNCLPISILIFASLMCSLISFSSVIYNLFFKEIFTIHYIVWHQFLFIFNFEDL